MDRNEEFGVQYGQIFEFEASEKGAEIGVIALEVRAGVKKMALPKAKKLESCQKLAGQGKREQV